MVEKLTHKGVEGVFIPAEDWERMQFLNMKKNNLLTQLVRRVKK